MEEDWKKPQHARSESAVSRSAFLLMVPRSLGFEWTADTGGSLSSIGKVKEEMLAARYFGLRGESLIMWTVEIAAASPSVTGCQTDVRTVLFRLVKGNVAGRFFDVAGIIGPTQPYL